MDCPFERSVVFFTLFTLFCSLACGFLAAFVTLDQPERPLYWLVEGNRHGQKLIVVETPSE